MESSSLLPRVHSAVEIAPAKLEDVETLVDIMIAALEPDLWPRFMFSERREEAVRIQRERFVPMVKKRWMEGAYISKATIEKTQKIAGYSIYRWHEGIFEDDLPWAAGEMAGQESFQHFFSRDSSSRHRGLMQGKTHVVLQSLYVLPEYQSQGIGTQLVKWPFEKYQLDQAPLFIQTLHRTSGFYGRFGFEQKDCTIVDLVQWGGKDNGFGIYSAPQLLKPAGPLAS